MKKFDPIDIFFIAMISTYFIVLISIGITFLCINFSKKKQDKLNTNVKEIEVVKEEKVKRNKNIGQYIKEWKNKLVSTALFRKLFMKEIKNTKNGNELLNTKKIKVMKKEKIELPIKEKTDNIEIAPVNEVKKEKEIKKITTNTTKKKSTSNKTNNNKTTSAKKSSTKTSTAKKQSAKKKTATSPNKAKTTTNKKPTSKNNKSTNKKTSNNNKNNVRKRTTSSVKKNANNKSATKKKNN